MEPISEIFFLMEAMLLNERKDPPRSARFEVGRPEQTTW